MRAVDTNILVRLIARDDPQPLVSAALDHFGTASAPGFTDCLIVEVARKAGHLPLGTFDKRLAKVDGAERL